MNERVKAEHFPVSLEARFEQVVPIGEGGMGRVFRAIDRRSGQRVAVKIIDAKQLQNPAYRRAFLREAGAILRLQHPNVLKLIDVDLTVHGEGYLVTEYVKGAELSSWRSYWPGWSIFLDAIDGVLTALGYAHARGFVHCDIKPSNLLFEEQSRQVLLADFGISRLAAHAALQLGHHSWHTNEVVGTPTYMAPEQAEGNFGAYGPWTDFYALGVVLYEIFSGKPPFDAPSVNAILLKQLKQAPPPLHWRKGLPPFPPIEPLLHRMLEKDPWDRPRFAIEIQRVLQALKKGAPREESQSLAFGEAGRDSALSSSPTAPPRVPTMRQLGPAKLRQEQEISFSAKALRTRSLEIIGRKDELHSLLGLADVVGLTQRPQVIFVEGGAGIGKSKLAQALREKLEEQGKMQSWTASFRPDAVHATQGLSGAIAAFYLCLGFEREALGRALEQRLRRYGGSSPWELRALLDWLRPDEESGLAMGAPSPAAIAGLVIKAIERACIRAPLLICLEDYHQGLNGELLPLIRRILAADPPLPVLLVATGRALDEAADPGAIYRDEMASLLSNDQVSRMVLAPLRDSDLKDLVAKMGLDEVQAEAIWRNSQGSPSRALQAARAALELSGLREDLSKESKDIALLTREYELGDAARPMIVSPLTSGPFLEQALGHCLERLPMPAAARILGLMALLAEGSKSVRLQAALELQWPQDDWEELLPQVEGLVSQAGLGELDDERGLLLEHPPLVELVLKTLAKIGDASQGARAAAQVLARHVAKSGGKVVPELGAYGFAVARAARLFKRAQRFEDAWSLLQEATQVAVQESRFTEALSLCAEAKGWLAEAEVAAEDPRWLELLRFEIRASLDCGAINDAERLLKTGQGLAFDPQGLAELALLRARIFAARGELEEAESAYQVAVQSYEALGDHPGCAAAKLGLAEALRSRGEVEQSLSVAAAANEIFAGLADRRGQASCLRVRAQALTLGGRLNEAIAAYEAALEYYEEAAEVHGQANTRRGLGGAYLALGNTELALDYFKDARIGYQFLGDQRGATHALWGLARARRMRGAVGAAMDDILQVVESFSALGAEHTAAEALLDLASMQRSLRQYRQAVESLKRAARTFRLAKDERGVASCHLTLGNLYLDLERPEEALAEQQQALRLFRRAKDPRGAMLSRLNLAHSYLREDMTHHAVPLLESVIQRAPKHGWLIEHGVALAYLAQAQLKLQRLNELGQIINQLPKPGLASSQELARALETLALKMQESEGSLQQTLDVLDLAGHHLDACGLDTERRRLSRLKAQIALNESRKNEPLSH